jgi:hypothetical protein
MNAARFLRQSTTDRTQRILDACEGLLSGTPVREIRARLMKTYGVARATVNRDMQGARDRTIEFSIRQLKTVRRLARRRLMRWLQLAEKAMQRGLKPPSAVCLGIHAGRQLLQIEALDRVDPVPPRSPPGGGADEPLDADTL